MQYAQTLPTLSVIQDSVAHIHCTCMYVYVHVHNLSCALLNYNAFCYTLYPRVSLDVIEEELKEWWKEVAETKEMMSSLDEKADDFRLQLQEFVSVSGQWHPCHLYIYNLPIQISSSSFISLYPFLPSLFPSLSFLLPSFKILIQHLFSCLTSLLLPFLPSSFLLPPSPVLWPASSIHTYMLLYISPLAVSWGYTDSYEERASSSEGKREGASALFLWQQRQFPEFGVCWNKKFHRWVHYDSEGETLTAHCHYCNTRSL